MAKVDKTISKVLQVLEIKQRLVEGNIKSSRHRIAALKVEVGRLKKAPYATEFEQALNLGSADWPGVKLRKLKELNQQIAMELLAEMDASATLSRYQAQAEVVVQRLEASQRKALRRHQNLRFEAMINERLCAPNGSAH